jgi:NADH dehydrogenase (ubiquinone) Fe-S protein 1
MGSPKPVASCAMPASNGMKVYTSSPRVKKAREAVIELLRANHPLDCPICDQGGECDLQDQSMRYGSDRTRMYESKRGVEDKYLGPLVKMVITRCIHCTRCIRFASEVAGLGVLGTSGRGSDTEVGTYVERVIESELSGNRVDRCPVGALTSKQIAFKARSWELDSVDTYDDTDSLVSSIRVQVIGNTIYRVLPRNNDEVNGQWLADKGRFIIDAYNTIRAKRVMVRSINNDYTTIDNMVEGVDYVGNVLDSMVNTLIVVSQSRDMASISTIKHVSNRLPSHGIISTGYSSNVIRNGYKSEYASMSDLTNLNSTDVVMIIGVDLRKEAPVVNTMRRNGYINGSSVISLGSQLRSTYPVESMSNNDIVSAYNGTLNSLSGVMKAYSISTVVGTSVMQRDSAIVTLSVLRDMIYYIATEGNVVVHHMVLHTRANTVGSMIVGIPGYNSSLEYNYYNSIINIGVLGSEVIEQGIDIVYNSINDISYSVMFTSWLDSSMTSMHDIVMPLVSNHEQDSVVVNTEGRYSTMKKVISGALSSDNGSVNSLMLSSLLSDGDVSVNVLGGYYNKRMYVLDHIYEAIDSECDMSNVPSVHDYYREGHSGASMSAKMIECSVMYTKSNSFSEL